MSVHGHRCPHCFRYWTCRDSICIVGGTVGLIRLVTTLACDAEPCAIAADLARQDAAYHQDLERRSGCYEEE